MRYFWSDQYDVKIQSLGDPDPAELVATLRVGPKQRTVAVYGRDGVVTAVVGLGVPRHVMRTRELVANRAPVSDVVSVLNGL